MKNEFQVEIESLSYIDTIQYIDSIMIDWIWINIMKLIEMESFNFNEWCLTEWMTEVVIPIPNMK